MPQAGIHAAIGFQLTKYFPNNKLLLPSILFGAILPDIDILFVAIATIFSLVPNPEFVFHRTFTHSFFTLTTIYLLFQIIGEYKNNLSIKSIGRGISIGILSHIIADTFFWFKGIHFLWPLPIGHFNLWESFSINPIVHRIILAFEFICFRYIGWHLIKVYLKNPVAPYQYILIISKWMKIEALLFIIFIILAIINISSYNIIFGVAYIPSLIFTLTSIYFLKDIFIINNSIQSHA